jgi:hypothetical protein
MCFQICFAHFANFLPWKHLVFSAHCISCFSTVLSSKNTSVLYGTCPLFSNIFLWFKKCDCLCGLVVRVPGYRSRGPGLILSATRFSEKQLVKNGVHSASWVQLRSYFSRNLRYGCRDPSCWPRGTLYVHCPRGRAAGTNREGAGLV